MNKAISQQLVDATNKSWDFKNLSELVEFLSYEEEFWKNNSTTVAQTHKELHIYLNAHTYITQILDTIKSWSNNIDSWNEETLNNNLKSIQPFIQKLRNRWIWSGHSFSHPFIECHKKYGILSATSFINTILNTQFDATNNRSSFFGSILAYEFLNHDSDIAHRHIGEESSLENLRNRLDNTTTKLIGDAENFKYNYLSWINKTKNEWMEWQTKADNDRLACNTSYNDSFNTYLNNCESRIKELENTYQEKLRLEKPATYWAKSSVKYGRQGALWALALIASILLGFCYFSDFFSSWLKGKELAINTNTVQGIILFGSILAIYAFLIRTLSRLAFSAFHLMRDAEEREQLTYLYLSLNNESQIDKSSRDIVLQSLFSRSETGLLASETGPTMPGASEILRTALKQK